MLFHSEGVTFYFFILDPLFLMFVANMYRVNDLLSKTNFYSS